MRDEGAASRSTQDLRSINELVTTARTAGQPVTLTQSGDSAAAPTAISREGYRVLQEAITNAMRHAVGAPTTVAVAAEPTRLVITVVNEHGEDVDPERSSGGRGLAGIAERVRILGGTVTSGPTADGGFRVHAELPYDGANE
jgi:signal transduction histidine kinase